MPYMRDLKRNDTNKFIYKTETDSQTQRTYGYQGEGEGQLESLGWKCTHFSI